MRCLLIVILCLVQFQVRATDWLNRTVRVDLIAYRQDFVRNYDTFERSDQMMTSSTVNNATNGQYPWSVMTIAWALQEGIGTGIPCTSTIIANNFALSNVLCAGQNPLNPVTTIEVFSGSVRLNFGGSPTNFVRHYWYITPSLDDSPDIVLFRLHESLTFNPNVQPIRLPSNGNFAYEAWSSYISGLRTALDGISSVRLISVQASIFNNELCNFVGVPVPDHELCGIEDAEPSESGPITRFVPFSGGSWIVYEYTAGFEFIPVLVGIYQYQFANETASFGYATRVSHFVEWIDTVSGNLVK